MTVFLTEVLQNLPHLAAHFGDPRCEYSGETYIGLRAPSGEWVSYDRNRQYPWAYSRWCSEAAGMTLAEAIARDAEKGEQNRLEYVASISGN